jgi:CDP-glucose 4,6-dehydratase
VLVTGHTGFKGGWLSVWLQSLGAEASGLALPPETNPSFFQVALVEQGMRSELGDVRDLSAVQQVVERAQPEVIFHLAAQPLVRRSYGAPVETFSTNVMGTVHLLEAARQTPSVRAVVVVTSDKCYENREWVWGYRESDPMGGHDPYSASKGCAELVTASYRKAFSGSGPLLATVRAGNVIGGGDWSEDRLLPDLVRAAERGEPAVIRNPHSIRPWQHVLEPLRGYLDVAQGLIERGGACAEAWNFGPAPTDARPVQWIARHLATLWGLEFQEKPIGAADPHEANFLRLDWAKAHAALGWAPRWPLETALEKLVAWHRAQQGGADMREFSLDQIDQYERS